MFAISEEQWKIYEEKGLRFKYIKNSYPLAFSFRKCYEKDIIINIPETQWASEEDTRKRLQEKYPHAFYKAEIDIDNIFSISETHWAAEEEAEIQRLKLDSYFNRIKKKYPHAIKWKKITSSQKELVFNISETQWEEDEKRAIEDIFIYYVNIRQKYPHAIAKLEREGATKLKIYSLSEKRIIDDEKSEIKRIAEEKEKERLRREQEKKEQERKEKERIQREEAERRQREEQAKRQREELERRQREEQARRLREEAERRQREEQARRERAEREKRERENQIRSVLQQNGVTCFYHFTARSNIESIKRRGGLYSWYALQQSGVKIPNASGDNISHSLDCSYGLQDYVRLSFCDDHPMAYRKRKEGADIVLLKVSIEVAVLDETMFSNMNATDNNHIHGSGVDYLNKVSFNATQRHYVSNTDPDFKLHQAEVMVKHFIPLHYILNINDF